MRRRCARRRGEDEESPVPLDPVISLEQPPVPVDLVVAPGDPPVPLDPEVAPGEGRSGNI